MLELNKKTVSHLNKQQQQKVTGGLCLKSTKRKCTWKATISFSGHTR